MSADRTAERFFRSAGAATFSQLWRVGVTLGVQLVLRRWIPPEQWGIWEWSLALFLILGAVRDLGLAYHVVRIRSRPYGNLLALELVWGGALAVAAAIGAPYLAKLRSDADPLLAPVLLSLALFLFLEGLATVPKTFFEAELRIGRSVVPEIVRNLVTAVLAVALAVSGWGVWALVISQVAGAAVYAVHLWSRAWGEIPLRWERGQTLPLVWKSSPLALIWLLAILIDQVDLLILGRHVSNVTLGNYSFAYFCAFLSARILVPAVTRSLYPALVAFVDRPRELFEAYRLATLFLVSLQAPVAFFLFANAEAAVRILGGGQWESAPPLLRILCLAPLVEPIGRLGGEVLKALHQDRVWILSSLATLAAFGLGGWWATGRFGAVGMAWVNFLPLGGLVMAWALHRLAPKPFLRLVGNIGFVYTLCAVPFVPLALLVPNRELRFGVSLVLAAAILGVLIHRYGGSFRAFWKDPVAAVSAEVE